MDKTYQEIVNERDFGFESFWSSVGGFVGIFLGYSLLEFPDLLDKLVKRLFLAMSSLTLWKTPWYKNRKVGKVSQ